MSFITGTQSETLFAGPTADYAAAAAASSSAQFLMTGATGNFDQPYIPAGFFQFGRANQYLRFRLCGKLTGQASATTAIWTVGLATAPNTATPGTGGGTLVATPAITVTSFSNAGWQVDGDILSRGTGYGTTSVSGNLLASCAVSVNTGTTAGISTVGAPTALQTIDATANWWLYATITFSTASATNSCTLQQAFLLGMN